MGEPQKKWTAAEFRHFQKTGQAPCESEPEPVMKGTGVYNFRYQGKIISTNELKSKHWRIRDKKEGPIKKSMNQIVRAAGMPKMEQVEIIAEFRSRHDVDNVSATIKLMVDQMVRLGLLPDDNTKHWPSVKIEYCKDLPNNTIDFTVIDLNF